MAERTDCPAFELLAVAYHEAGHAVGTSIVSSALIVEFATIVPGEGLLGRVTYGDWSENIIPDSSVEDLGDEICEHERKYLEAENVVSYLGALAEGQLQTGCFDKPTVAGWDGDRDDVAWNTYVLMGDDLWRKTGRGHRWDSTAHFDPVIALTERHPHFWRAVGLVAGTLMRQKTLDGSEIADLVRVAQSRGSAG